MECMYTYTFLKFVIPELAWKEENWMSHIKEVHVWDKTNLTLLYILYFFGQVTLNQISWTYNYWGH